MKLLIILSLISFLSHSQKESERCKYQEYYQDVSNALTEKHSNKNWTKANEIFNSALSEIWNYY